MLPTLNNNKKSLVNDPSKELLLKMDGNQMKLEKVTLLLESL